MLSTALIDDTEPARCVNSASVLAALSRIACEKAFHSGVWASVIPSCDCKARIRWSTAAWVVAEGTGVAGCAVDGEAVVGAVAGVEGSEVVADWAKPMDGASNAARATPRAKFEINMVTLQ